MIVELTEEQAAARLRAIRARHALQDAPETVQHIRASMYPSDGRTERGESVTHHRTPLLTRQADDADKLYKFLVDETTEWSKLLRIAPPVTSIVAQRNVPNGEIEVVGFRAGTTSTGAFNLARLLTVWLLIHADEINRHPDGYLFQDDVAERVWKARAAHGLTSRHPISDTLDRPCPLCRRLAVRAAYFGEAMQAPDARAEFDMSTAGADDRHDPKTPPGRRILDAVAGIQVACSACTWVEIPKPMQIVKWLERADQYNPNRKELTVCERCDHGRAAHAGNQCRVGGCECCGFKAAEGDAA